MPRSEQLRGKRFGGCEVLGLIGHGATSSVFEGRHVALEKPIAVKVLHEHLANDAQIAGRFLREGRVAARLHHPNIVDVTDVGVQDGIPYLVMELLTGADLRALLADTGSLTPTHALGFLLPILSAVAHTHDAGVLHRDLKPANIFLARDVRENVVPKLLDFGLSKAADLDEGSLTSSALVAGTVLYMAPEQTRGMKNSSPASDQYSLGAILYECLTGEPPFLGDGEGGIYVLIERIRTAHLPSPSQVNPRLPRELDEVVMRALDRDPEKRFASVRALGRALLPFAAPETATAVERDFAEAASGSGKALSRPKLGRARGAGAEAARIEGGAEASAVHGVAPLPCPAGTSPFRIKGMSYRGFVHLVNQTLPSGLDAFCEGLEDKSLATFMKQPFLASGRYDILPFLPLFAHLARLLSTSFDELVRTASAAQTRYDARTAYTRIYDGATPSNIAERMARFNRQFYDFGEFAAGIDSPNTSHVEYAFVPAYAFPWLEPMFAAYSEEAMRIVGAKNVVVESQPPARAGRKGRFELLTGRALLRWE